MQRILVLLIIFCSFLSYSHSYMISHRAIAKVASYHTSSLKKSSTPNSQLQSRISSRRNLFPDPLIWASFQSGLLTNSILASSLLLTKQKSLTSSGLAHAWALGVGLWTFLGIEGWEVGVAYFILGSAVTNVKMMEKEKAGIAEKRGGARGPENVWGSAATGMICAMGSYFFPQLHHIFKLGFVASMATKLSDTAASEIGKAYGRTTFLITSFERVQRGMEGAVSLEGTLAGVLGSLVLSLLGVSIHLIQAKHIIPCLLAAFIANIAESYIGAIVQDKVPWLTNEFVNFLNTSIGAVIAMTLAMII